MFKWLRKKAGETSLFNVKINTKSLILISNRAHENIQATGRDDDALTREVMSDQVSLLEDMRLAIDNGMSIQDVKASVEQAKSQHPVSKGAEMAIEHVLKSLDG
jgi:hypothetical protein|tara:strand:- start:21 stop:332 length:312 start_codon:yes stop_codon:yes gene_type:complete